MDIKHDTKMNGGNLHVAPETYDPKHIDTSRKVTIRQRLNDFKPDQTPGKKILVLPEILEL